MSISVLPYQPSYDAFIKQLEDGIVQGKGIQLKIIKKHFLDRSAVFTKWHPLLAINNKNEVVGTAIGAETKMMVNGTLFKCGVAFDAKVHPAYRNQGIGRRLAKELKEWFKKEGWEKNFTTLKLSNAPVIKLSAKAIGNVWLTPIVYLTIPTSTRVRTSFLPTGNNRFSIRLFNEAQANSNYFTNFPGGLSCFHTWKLYQLKIEKVSPLYKQSLRLLKWLNPRRYASLPEEGACMEFATLFNHSEQNISFLNEVLQHLQQHGKKFLLVCCRKGDSIYHHLKKSSINTYGYYILTDFPITQNDALTIDVRCL